MKCLIYILFLVLLALPLHAQNEKHYTERLDSIITSVNMAGEVKSVFTYDKTGLLIEKIEYREKKEGKWINPEQTLYTYDGNGRIVSLTSKPNGTGLQGEWFRERREYDSSGNLISVTFEGSQINDDKWKKKGSVDYVYDNKGHQMERTDYYYKDGERKEKLKIEMDYDKKGQLTTKREYEFINDEMQLWRTYRYYYDKRGNLCTTKKFFSEHYDKTYYPTTTTETVYNRHGEIASTLTQTELGTDKHVKKEKYSYDHHGNLIQIVSFYPGEGGMKHKKSMSLTYDVNTNMASVMGLSCQEVLVADEVLGQGLKMECKPLSVQVSEVDNPHFHEKTTYYYSPINEMTEDGKVLVNE